MTNEEEIKNICELLIVHEFKMAILVNIISAKDLIEVLGHAPLWWNTAKESKNNAIFVIPPVTVKEIFEQIGEYNPKYENVDYYDRVIFWPAPVKTFPHTKCSKINQLFVYSSITIHNANTTIKLSQLVKKQHKQHLSSI